MQSKPFAFIRRDFQIESSYKLNFFMRAINTLMPLVFFFFLSKLVAAGGTESLGKIRGGYFPFVMIGLAFARYFQLSLNMFSNSIRTAQMTGCLEAMLSSQSGPVPIVLMSSLYGLISAGVQLLLIVVVSVWAFGIDFTQANIPASILIFLLSILTFISFGVFSAAIIVRVKKGDPVVWVFTTLGTILGGAYFPVDVMPVWLQRAAALVPIKYSLDALRLTLLNGHSIPMVARPALILGLMTLVLLPLSVLSFSLAVRQGRKDGTLMQY